MADQPETFTLDELHSIVVPDGRCPHCGRPADSQEKQVFEELRSELGAARKERDDGKKRIGVLEDSNALYEAEVASLKSKVEGA